MATAEPIEPGMSNDGALQRFDQWAETSPVVGQWLEEAAARAQNGQDESLTREEFRKRHLGA